MKQMKGHVYITLLLLVVIIFGFILSGGLILSDESSSTVDDSSQFVPSETGSLPAFSTLQLSTLNFTTCSLKGLDIALVIDRSASVDSTELAQMKTAMNSFITSLSGNSTNFSVITFATTAQVVQGFTDDFNKVRNAINSISVSSGIDGATNWQDALVKAKSTFPNRSNSDLIFFVSDDIPNMTGDNGATDSSGLLINGAYEGSSDYEIKKAKVLSDAIAVADEIKSNGIKILSLGIGDQINVQSLQKISGSKAGTGSSSDVFVTSNFNNLTADITAFTEKTCE